MKRTFLLITLILVLIQFSIQAAEPAYLAFSSDHCFSQEECNYFSIPELYNSLKGDRPSYESFYVAMEGFLNLKKKGVLLKENILTLIDYSLSSAKKRLWVIDVSKKEILYNELVAHGMNSGSEFAQHFSNKAESYMSSLGFYVTGSTYNGKNGLSLQLDGMEKGINDNARSRTIVIHMAKYVSQNYIDQCGRLGRSFGCPALPGKTGENIIDTMAGGTCLFIFYPDDTYFLQSSYVNGNFDNDMGGRPLSIN